MAAARLLRPSATGRVLVAMVMVALAPPSGVMAVIASAASSGTSSSSIATMTTTTTTSSSTTVASAPANEIQSEMNGKWQQTDNDEGGSATRRALHWLEQQRHADWGWGNDTHRALIALQIANESKNDVDSFQPSLEMQLSAKQLEVEMLLLLWKHRETPVSSRQLAEYTLALVALCKDPRRFHGHDLVGALLHREPAHSQELALATLAGCAAGARARRRHIRRLLDTVSAPADHNLDTMASVILALRCIVRDHRHRSLQPFLRRPLAGLAHLQLPDGSFGGLRTTALTIQALEDSSDAESTQQQWNRSAAIRWLAQQQGADGGFGDIATTAEAALALSGMTVAATRKCPHSEHAQLDPHEPSDGPPRTQNGQHPYNESDARNVSFTYTLWVGTNVTDNYTLYMVAPRNISFYHVMQMAAEMDPRFEFSASEWPNGHYVHTIAGCREEPMGYHYWLLYRLHEQPDPANPPGNQLVSPVGVDDLPVEEGEHYLFWYKRL